MMYANCETDVKDIVESLAKIDYDLSEKIKTDSETLIKLADEMAESATSFGGHGYKSFLESREKFVGTLCKISKDYTQLMTVLRCKC